MREGKITTFFDYIKEMRAFQKFFMECGPEGPFRKEIILDFVQNKITSTADFFINSTNN